jgi:hypothetical protein
VSTTTIERPAVGRLLNRVTIIQVVTFGLFTLSGIWQAFSFGHSPEAQLGRAFGSLPFAVFVVAGVQICRGRRTGVTISKYSYVVLGVLVCLVSILSSLFGHSRPDGTLLATMLWALPLGLLWGVIFASPALYFHRSKQARALAGNGPVGEPRAPHLPKRTPLEDLLMAAANQPTPYTKRGWSGASKAIGAGLLRAIFSPRPGPRYRRHHRPPALR